MLPMHADTCRYLDNAYTMFLTCVYIYIKREIEREREREIHIHTYIYLYDHSSSDKEIDGRGPGSGEKANEEAFEDDGSKEHTIRLAD